MRRPAFKIAFEIGPEILIDPTEAHVIMPGHPNYRVKSRAIGGPRETYAPGVPGYARRI